MKKYKSIIAFGDSFVAGFGLDEDVKKNFRQFTSILEMDQHTMQYAFPHRLAAHLDIPCYNYAMSAASNLRSLRKLYDILSSCDVQNSLILFGYTSTDRHEFYDHNLVPGVFKYFNQDESNFLLVQTDLINNKEGFKLHPESELHARCLGSDYQSVGQIMFYVDAACYRYSVDCVHIPCLPFKKEFVPKNLFSFDGHDNFVNWCKHNNYRQLSCKHFERAAHEKFATLLIDYLDTLSI
jgi:hypothetical protein